MKSARRVWTVKELEGADLPPVPLAVLGDPVAHSLSPLMHEAALAAMARADARFARWTYRAVHVSLESLPAALERLHALGFAGLNLTLPHKVRALELVERVRPEAISMGAVNTLIRTPTGYEGTNTDGWGIARAVEETLGRGFGDGPCVLLGAGGAARAIAVQALAEGATELWIGNRSAPNLERLHAQLETAQLPLERVRCFLFADPPDALPKRALVVNATSVGLKADETLPFALDRFGAGSALYDTTYGARNAWAEAAAQAGLPYADGRSMLVHQGVRSLQLWTDAPIPAAVMSAAVNEALAGYEESP